jgi:hypothetical protein
MQQVFFSIKKFKKYYFVYKRLWCLAHKLPRTTKKLLWKPVKQSTKLSSFKNIFIRFFNSGEHLVLFRKKQCCFHNNILYTPLFFLNHFSDFYQYTLTLFRTAKSGFLLKRFAICPINVTNNFLCNKFSKDLIISSHNYLLFLNQSTFFTMSLYYSRWLQEIFRVIFFFVLIKIKYKGKSYKWFRKNKTLVLRFGYSHIVLINIPNFFFHKKKGKMKLIFFGTCLWNLKSFLSSIIAWRPMNVYTGRGLRFAKQLVFRKFGKVSAYR